MCPFDPASPDNLLVEVLRKRLPTNVNVHFQRRAQLSTALKVEPLTLLHLTARLQLIETHHVVFVMRDYRSLQTDIVLLLHKH